MTLRAVMDTEERAWKNPFEWNKKRERKKEKKKWNESRLVEAVRFSVLELLIDFLEPADALNNANRQQKKDSTLE